MGIPPILGVVEPLPPIMAHAILLLDVGPTEFDLGLVLPDLQREAGRGVPGDMAMQDPEAGVIGAEADGHVAVLGQESNIAARRVVVLEGAVGQVVQVEGPRLLGEKDEVVSVQMHGVGKRQENAFALGDLLRRALARHDDVDPIVFGEVVGDHGCFVGAP